VRGGEDGPLIVGFGVNHGHRPHELPPGATSLRVEGAALPPLGALAWELTAAVLGELERAGDSAYAVAQYAPLSAHRVGDRLRCQMYANAAATPIALALERTSNAARSGCPVTSPQNGAP